MAKPKHAPPADWIQERVIARAAELGLTAYAVGRLVMDHVSPSHVYDYLARRKSCGSHKLQHILRALGLTITAE